MVQASYSLLLCYVINLHTVYILHLFLFFSPLHQSLLFSSSTSHASPLCLSVSPAIDSSHSFYLQWSQHSPSLATCFLFPLSQSVSCTLPPPHPIIYWSGNRGGTEEMLCMGSEWRLGQYFHKGYLRPLPLSSSSTIPERHTAGS